MPTITLPDGSQRQFEHVVTVAEVAASIGAGLAKAALAGKLDGQLVDTTTLIEQDAQLSIITDKDAEGLDVIRHSCAHLMAQAVKQLFPNAQVTIGPVVENGFYYDFAYEHSFTPEDLEKIQARMEELANQEIAIQRTLLSRDAAIQFFHNLGETYKVQVIEAIPTDEPL